MENTITVVKVGSNTIVDDQGIIRSEVIHDIIATLGSVIREGGRVILVTSGAVKLGRVSLGKDVSAAVAASVGQTLLFDAYLREANKSNLVLAQFLLTRPYTIPS